MLKDKYCVEFKDRNIYTNMKYSCSHKFLWKNETHIACEIELIHEDSCWHSMMPFEHELKSAEELGTKESLEYVKFWSPYKKWQKRKLYTIEEFDKTLRLYIQPLS